MQLLERQVHCPCKNTAFFLASLFESSCPENHSDARIQLALMSSADTFITLHRERKVDYAPDWSVPVNLIVSKNKHGFCGTCRMYFIPQIMLFKGSCIKESFVSIPDIYEPVTPYGENELPRCKHARYLKCAEIQVWLRSIKLFIFTLEDIEDIAQPEVGEELLIQISY